MALSNWDTLAVDESGKPTSGVIEDAGIVVEIYKNWLYVRDPRSWSEDCGFTGNVVAQISSGDIEYKKVEIVARRGPQNGVFALVAVGPHDAVRIMAGCGVSGYSHPPRPCGHEDAPMNSGDDGGWTCSDCGDPVPDAEWVGVTEESKKFLANLVEETIPVWGYDDTMVVSLTTGIAGGLRFNQGDAFLAQHLGLEVPATPAGDSEPTILSQMIKEIP